jgi:hypothetical protein
MIVSDPSQQDLRPTGATVFWVNFVTICGTMISKIKPRPDEPGGVSVVSEERSGDHWGRMIR